MMYGKRPYVLCPIKVRNTRKWLYAAILRMAVMPTRNSVRQILNLRARRKRMLRRELIVAERARIAAAEEQRRAAAEAARVAAEETAAAARSERNRIKRESRVDRTNCITARTAAWRRLSVGRESRSVKPSFSDRFRGPGYKAATIKTEQAPARLPEPAVCRLNDVGRD